MWIPLWIVKPNPHHHFSDVAVRYEQNHPGFIGTGHHWTPSFGAPGIECVSTIEAVPPCCLKMGDEPSVLTKFSLGK